MSKSSYVLKIQKDNTIYTCDLYTTQEEARSTIYPTYRLFKVNINGQTLYAPFTKTLDSARESTPLICPIFENDNDLTKYCLAQKSFFKINITTAANETITVTAEGTSWSDTDSHWFPYGTTWTASVAGATGYNAGALSPGSSGTLTNANVTVTAGAASLKTYILKVNGTSHQTITLKYKNRNAANTGYEAEVTKTITTTAEQYTVRHGTTWTATVAGATGWNAGTITSSGTVTAATTLTATAATHKTYTITLTQKANETVTIHYKNHNGTSLATSWSTKTSSVTLGHGSQYYCTIAASTGYTAGTITSPGTASSPNTLTAAKTISFTAATLKDWTVKIQITDLMGLQYPSDIAATVKYNQSGTTKTLNIKGRTTYTIYVRHNTKLTWHYNGKQHWNENAGEYYVNGSFYINNSSGTRLYKLGYGKSWTGAAITANTTFKCDDDG